MSAPQASVPIDSEGSEATPNLQPERGGVKPGCLVDIINI
jgi:hypothetical protein